MVNRDSDPSQAQGVGEDLVITLRRLDQGQEEPTPLVIRRLRDDAERLSELAQDIHAREHLLVNVVKFGKPTEQFYREFGAVGAEMVTRVYGRNAKRPA